MEIAFLSGAYKNAGDFLIEQRSIDLLRYVLHNAEIYIYKRNQIIENIDNINLCDSVVIGGGPLYQPELNGYMPLEFIMKEVKSPIMIMGAGWKGIGTGYNFIYKYKFSDITMKFLQHIDKYGYGLGCRDIYTMRTLLKDNLKNVYMTGCPAWYNLKKINQFDLNNNSWNIKKIVVSDPANLDNLGELIILLKYLKDKFSKAKITCLFHRGINSDKYTPDNMSKDLQGISEKIRLMKVDVKDISYGVDGFNIYNDCDLHIGFRVHVHIYNLSIRNRSILIEEDGRGAGVNEALGLVPIRAYDDTFQIASGKLRRLRDRLGYTTNKHFIDEVDSYIRVLQETDDQYILNAFKLQQKYFKMMVNHISLLRK